MARRNKGNSVKPAVDRAMRSTASTYSREREEQLLIEAISQKGRLNVDCDSRIEYITELLVRQGINVQPTRALKFHNPAAAGGVEMGLRNLVLNPAPEVDLSLPWAGIHRDAKGVHRLLKKLTVPKWARELQEASLESLSIPNVEGMINSDGSHNKDLEQMLMVNPPINRLVFPNFQAHWDKAREDYANRIISYYVANHDELVEVVTKADGSRKLRLRPWSLEILKAQMSKAFNSSTPGYPFNGYSWYSEVDGKTCVEWAWEAFEALMSQEEIAPEDGFLFFQQSRATGDGGANHKGRQRLVQAAEIREKVIGHMLAYVFKGPNKAPILSGQRGIQEVSRNAKRLCQGKISPWYSTGTPTHVAYWDVSKWDAAQTNESLKEGFFWVARFVLDNDCPLTSKVLSHYERLYLNRRLVTAMGEVTLEILPSGSSITTGAAFSNHEIYLRTMDYEVIEQTGEGLFVDFGLQGDDFFAFLKQWNETCDSIIRNTYEAFNCVIKGEAKVKSLADKDVSAVFLNEAILLYSDPDLDTNAKFPKWNLFWAENFRDLQRGANIDRMLLAEIQQREPHPSPLELTMASLFSKLDRFTNMPFYEYLVEQLLKWSSVPIYSWHVERVMPQSPTARWLRDREIARGIELPSPEQRALDRQESKWLLGTELGQALVVLELCSKVSSDARETCKKIRDIARQTAAYKKARDVLASVGVNADGSGDIPIGSAKELIVMAFNVGYKDVAEALAAAKQAPTQQQTDTYVALQEFISDEFDVEGKSDIEPPQIKTMMRALLAMNAHNPFELREKMARAVIQAYTSPRWWELPDEEVDLIHNWFTQTYGITLEQAVQGSNLLDLAAVEDWN